MSGLLGAVSRRPTPTYGSTSLLSATPPCGPTCTPTSARAATGTRTVTSDRSERGRTFESRAWVVVLVVSAARAESVPRTLPFHVAKEVHSPSLGGSDPFIRRRRSRSPCLRARCGQTSAHLQMTVAFGDSWRPRSAPPRPALRCALARGVARRQRFAAAGARRRRAQESTQGTCRHGSAAPAS